MFAPDADAPLGDACDVANAAEAEAIALVERYFTRSPDVMVEVAVDLLDHYVKGADREAYSETLAALLDLHAERSEECARYRATQTS